MYSNWLDQPADVVSNSCSAAGYALAVTVLQDHNSYDSKLNSLTIRGQGLGVTFSSQTFTPHHRV